MGRQTTHDYARFGTGAGVCTVPRTAPALDDRRGSRMKLPGAQPVHRHGRISIQVRHEGTRLRFARNGAATEARRRKCRLSTVWALRARLSLPHLHGERQRGAALRSRLRGDLVAHVAAVCRLTADRGLSAVASGEKARLPSYSHVDPRTFRRRAGTIGSHVREKTLRDDDAGYEAGLSVTVGWVVNTKRSPSGAA
jgi:hypothetical protein